jgi:RNA polymerase sigma-70 factor (ECF subfamily)
MSSGALPDNFPSLVRTYGDKAYGFAFRLTHNEADARDLVQEAFTKALQNFDKFDRTRAFEPWFFRIMKNIFLDWMRRYERKHTTSLENTSPTDDRAWEEILPSSEKSPDEHLERREEESTAMKALHSLPAHYRTAITLCDIENYSYEQIAKVMDCPVGTIRSRIHQGRVLLKQTYEKMLFKSETVEN